MPLHCPRHELAPSLYTACPRSQASLGYPGRHLCALGAAVKRPSAEFLIQTMNAPGLQSGPFTNLQHFPNPPVLMLPPSSLGKPLEDRIFVMRENIRRMFRPSQKTMEYKRNWRTGKGTESSQHETESVP